MRAHALLAILLVVVAVTLAAGCGESRTATVDSGPGAVDSGAVDSSTADPRDSGPPPDPTNSATLAFGPNRLQVGEEDTVCVVLDAGNSVARQVRSIRTHLPIGSHHMIIYRTSAPVQPTPFSCFPAPFDGATVFIAETVDAELVYPSEAALEFAPHQHIQIEIHEINYTEAPIDVTASVTFEFYPTTDAARAPVHFLFTGSASLNLPPRQETTVHSFRRVPAGARIFGLTSHMHSLGTYAAIQRARSETDFDEEPLHESTEWAEPPLDVFDPPLVLGAGEGFRVTCTYFNSRSEAVRFGFDFDDEMCFLWAYYY